MMSLRSLVSRFYACQQGGFLILAALSLVVLLAIVGLAIDSARATLVRNNMQAAADVAVLAAGDTYRREMQLGTSTPAAALAAAEATAERYFLANLRTQVMETPTNQLLDQFDFQRLGSGELEVTYNAPVGLTFGRFASDNGDDLTPSVVARVGLNSGPSIERLPVEIVYVVDSSRSMAGCTTPPASGIPAGSTCITGYTNLGNGVYQPQTAPGLPASAALSQSIDAAFAALFEGEQIQERISAKTLTYSNNVLASGSFVSNINTLRQQMSSYDPTSPNSLQTNILTPVQQANSDLSAFVSPVAATTGQQVVEVMVLMSDGRHNIEPGIAQDNNLSVQSVINACGDFISNAPSGVRREVFTVYFRTPTETNPVAAELLLRECASNPGYAFTADDLDELNDAYQNITSEIIAITTIGKPRLTL